MKLNPLYDPAREPDIDPADAIVVARRFVFRCRAWAAEREIPKRLARLAAEPDPEEAARLHAWIAYAAFLERTLRELEDGTLDAWFDDAPPSPPVAPAATRI